MDDENQGTVVVGVNAPPSETSDVTVAELQRLKRELKVNSQIGEIFHRVTDDELYGEVLPVVLEATNSRHGVFGYIDEHGDLVCPSMTRDVWQQCQVPEKSVTFPQDSWGDTQWGRALREKRTVCQNRPGRVPEGHVPIRRSVSVPIAYKGNVVGLFMAGNKLTDYDEDDVSLLEGIAGNVAPILIARLERDREERERRRVYGALHRIEWLLTEQVHAEGIRGTGRTPHDDVAGLNTCRELIESVGEDVLRTVMSEYLDLLDTSAVVFEQNGDYALDRLCSGWCRMLDRASRDLCRTDDDREALACGKWLCHESCWTEASQRSIASGEAVDIQCNGGIRLYAVPIWAGDEIVGSMNFGYGDPPRNPDRLRDIAARYGLNVEELRSAAGAYNSRPAYLIEIAKRRLSSAARLVGAMIERSRAEADLRRAVAAERLAQQQLLDQQRLEKEHVETELAKVREELVRKTRLAAVGQVSASIAHDLRNPLGAVRNAAYYLKRRVPEDDPELPEFLQIIDDEVANADRIISTLLELTRARPVDKQTVELCLLVDDAFGRIEDADGVRCRISTSPDPFPIQADPVQFRQLLVNLGKNAVQAMEGEGEFFVEAWRNGGSDVIVVRDMGPGIRRDLLEELFEPLVTTKAKGTGLGLTICRQIIERHGGTIEPIRDEQRGAAFRISLPALEKSRLPGGERNDSNRSP